MLLTSRLGLMLIKEWNVILMLRLIVSWLDQPQHTQNGDKRKNLIGFEIVIPHASPGYPLRQRFIPFRHFLKH